MSLPAWIESDGPWPSEHSRLPPITCCTDCGYALYIRDKTVSKHSILYVMECANPECDHQGLGADITVRLE